jgi:hypothetical protein
MGGTRDKIRLGKGTQDATHATVRGPCVVYKNCEGPHRDTPTKKLCGANTQNK